MPKLLHQPPSYRHHKASGQALVTLNGCDFYLGPWRSAKSKQKYQRLTSQWLANGGNLPAKQFHTTTITVLLAAFWRHAKSFYIDADGKPSTEQKNYRLLIKRFRKVFGETLICDFGPLKLKAFRQILVGMELARGNINHQINRVRHIFKWGVENELVRSGVFEALRCVAGLRFGKTAAKETEPVRPVPDALVDAVLPHVVPQVRAMIELQRVTGMRSGEVCLMRMADIRTAGDVWTYTPARHKTQYRGHVRTVFLIPKAQEILRPWLRTNLESYLFSPAEAVALRRQQQQLARKTPLSCGNRPGTNRKQKPKKSPGDRYTAGSYGRAIVSGCEFAFGMPAELRRRPTREKKEERLTRYKLATEWRRENTWHPHQLRHNAATYFRKEYGLEVARVLLGHKHAAITEVYAEADVEKAVEVVGKIG